LTQDNDRNYRQLGMLWLVIFAGLALTFFATRETVRLSERQAAAEFNSSAMLFSRRVQGHMSAGLNAAQDLLAFYADSSDTSLEIFLRMVRTNSALNKNRRVISLALALPQGGDERFSAIIDQFYKEGYQIKEPQVSGSVLADSRRFPLLFTWTGEQALVSDLLGINIGAHKDLNAFLEAAMAQSVPSAIFLPSFPDLDGGNSDQLLLANPFITKSGLPGLVIQLVDFPGLLSQVREEMASPEALMHLYAKSRWGDGGHEIEFGKPQTSAMATTISPFQKSFVMGEGSWSLTITPGANAFPVDYSAAFVTASVCVLLTGLFFFIVWSQLRRARRVADIVNRRTRALKEAHDELEEHYKLLQNLNKDVEESRRSAELANRAKSEFLATMSHELRTPLNAILGFSQILSEQALGPIGDSRYVEYSNDIHSSGSHLLSLINDILDLAKLEAGKIHIEKNAISTRLLAERVVTLLSQQAENKGIEFKAEFEENMPDNILGDELRLRQILINLCTNAIKFTQTGSVTTRLFSKPFKNGQAGWVFEVQDTGMGIPEEKQATLFDRFTQVDAALSRRHGGVGLGLAICRQLVDRMGGKISVRSMVNVGTTVRVHLPLEEASKSDIENEMMI